MAMLSSLFSSFFPKRTYAKHPILLISIDGWGIAPASRGNALTQARLPYWNSLLATYPNTTLIASGESVGLPANEVGNSEVGHLTMGAGRIMYESLLRINKAIEDESFYRIEGFGSAVNRVIGNNGMLHLIGLVGSGNVHSSTAHLLALLELCKRRKVAKVALHLFTDGRDAPPRDGVNVMTSIEYAIKNQYQFARIATLSGRYYAMDRDLRWERTEKTYNSIVLGEGKQASSAVEAISTSYKDGKTDEFLEPTVIPGADGKPIVVNEGDSCIFFNFRVDRPRQLTKAFVLPSESAAPTKDPLVLPFVRKKAVKDLFFVTMTEYQEGIPVSCIAFPNMSLTNSLPEVLSQHNYKQFHLAESEKERMVTYYFDGLRSDPFPNEDVKIIPSPRVGTYDKKPEMSLPELVSILRATVDLDTYDFMMMNFANPDMVAHSGKLAATIKACEVVDWALSKIVEKVLEADGAVFITADHGNAEELLTFDPSAFFFTSKEGSMNTEHSNNPVPFVLICNSLKGKTTVLETGSLADVAPTILTFAKLPIPHEMTGHNLLKT